MFEVILLILSITQVHNYTLLHVRLVLLEHVHLFKTLARFLILLSITEIYRNPISLSPVTLGFLSGRI